VEEEVNIGSGILSGELDDCLRMNSSSFHHHRSKSIRTKTAAGACASGYIKKEGNVGVPRRSLEEDALPSHTCKSKSII